MDQNWNNKQWAQEMPATNTRNSRQRTTILSDDSNLMTSNSFTKSTLMQATKRLIDSTGWLRWSSVDLLVCGLYNTSIDNSRIVSSWQMPRALTSERNTTIMKAVELDELWWIMMCHLGLQVQLKYAHKMSFIGYLNPNQTEVRLDYNDAYYFTLSRD